jgi:hypothetical protein
MYNEIEKRHLINLTISSIGDKATSRYNYKRVDEQELAEIIDYAIENGTYIDVINGYHVSVDIPERIKRYILRKREELILKYFPKSTYVAYPNSDIDPINIMEYDNVPRDNFMINHINADIQINPYQAKKAQNIYLKQGETVPKGNMPMYASTNVIRIDDKKIKENEAFGFNGTLNSITLVKSRTAPPNTSTSLVHDPNIGFDPTLSLYMMLKEDGMINGAGVGCYFGDHNDCKFSQKNFKEKFESNPELRQYFKEACEIDLVNKINRVVNKSKAEEETIGCLMNNLLAARIEE